MIDIHWLRQYPKIYMATLARRHMESNIEAILDLDQKLRHSQSRLQEAQEQRNTISKQIGLQRRSGLDTSASEDQVASLKETMRQYSDDIEKCKPERDHLLACLPNILDDDVPKGADADANIVIRQSGQARQPDDTTHDHVTLGQRLGGMDFKTAATLSGSRFVILKDILARLERALAAFMLDTHRQQFGYQEVSPPYLVRQSALFGTGQWPKFANDLYHTTDDMWLIPTAEVSLINLAHNTIFTPEALPQRLVAYTPCFRQEAGAAGQDTRGLIRQHQFGKVELVSFTTPDGSPDELERMTACAEHILKSLGLAWQVVTLSAGDTGFSAAKTYDIEVWMVGQNRYREISSCSNCRDFQARRINARLNQGGKDKPLIHTLNGSALAVGRTLAAVLENGQNTDGSINLPEVLTPYLGTNRIKPPA